MTPNGRIGHHRNRGRRRVRTNFERRGGRTAANSAKAAIATRPRPTRERGRTRAATAIPTPHPVPYRLLPSIIPPASLIPLPFPSLAFYSRPLFPSALSASSSPSLLECTLPDKRQHTIRPPELSPSTPATSATAPTTRTEKKQHPYANRHRDQTAS
ncbi:hypothetical protein FKP32DRAFT_97979 [Trametes sanguinea]|nr:hypothetical protein FKP32DRAFT_97979 [Trametes sanguinea]